MPLDALPHLPSATHWLIDIASWLIVVASLLVVVWKRPRRRTNRTK
jgi:hypothetical protein